MTSWLYGGGGIPFQLNSDSLPHAHAQTTKTYYKHQDLRIKKAQELKTKTSANSDVNSIYWEIVLCLDLRVNKRQMQTTEEKVDTSKVLDASLVNTESSGTESRKQDTSSISGNDAHADDADMRPIYDEEPMAEVQLTAENNVFATGQQHSEQPEFNNEREVDQNAEQCHDKYHLPAKLIDNQITELSHQSLKSKNICLKKTVAQFQKDFSRMKVHYVNLELKYQNQALKEGQRGQFLKVKSNESKVKHDIDVIESINIELEHKVAKLLKENETLKRHYKELLTQLQEKGFAIAALKNELRKLTGNSVNTKFARTSILWKPVLQPYRNQSVVRQPTAFKSERPRISKPWCTSQVDVNNDLSKPVTTHYFPKEIESAAAKSYHVIASSNSRNSLKNMPKFSSNDMVHNHYLEEAKNKTHDIGRNSKPSVMSSARSQSLRWVPTGKIFTSSITKVDSEPTNGLNDDITNQYECEQTLDVSAGTVNLNAAMTSDHNSSELRIHDHNNEPSSLKLVPKVVPSADITFPSKQELDILFGPLYNEFFTAGTSCVNKSSSPTDNSKQQDTPPSVTAQSTIELITPTTTITAEDNIPIRRIHQEDTAYLCLHSPKDQSGLKINTPYPEDLYTPYSRYGI
ncbi:hypothetical protein Tco_0555536 [Tanacetum coccineum]